MFRRAVLCSAMILLALTGNLAGEVASMDSIAITTVYDNNAFVEGLVSSWGFSCLVQGLEKTILFDTGADGDILLANMERLGLEPQMVQVIVLSHLHGDHTGGLADFLKMNHQVTVYLLDSFPGHLKGEVTAGGAKLVTVKEPMDICPGALLTGPMGTTIPEQALVLQAGQGLVVITGCAHPGIVDVIERSREVGQGSPYLVMGGFHLFGASGEQIGEIVDQFRKAGVVKVSPCHCTGPGATETFRSAYGQEYVQNGVGRRIVLKR